MRILTGLRGLATSRKFWALTLLAVFLGVALSLATRLLPLWSGGSQPTEVTSAPEIKKDPDTTKKDPDTTKKDTDTKKVPDTTKKDPDTDTKKVPDTTKKDPDTDTKKVPNPKEKKEPPKLTPVQQLTADADAAIKGKANGQFQIEVPREVSDAEFDRVCRRYRDDGWRATKGLGDSGQRYLVLRK